MADIQLRFHKDILVLSTPVSAHLRRTGVDFDRDNELLMLLEPETFEHAYALEASVGAQCLVTNTASITPARLSHSRMASKAQEIAKAAISVVAQASPQHILVEIGPCGLPLDASSSGSLKENRGQYERAGKTFADMEPLIDAYFLNSFTSCVDLKCALMGLRKVTDKPIFASVDLAKDKNDAEIAHKASELSLGGLGREKFAEALAVMAEYGAQVAGFATSAGIKVAEELVREVSKVCVLPSLAQLRVREVAPELREQIESGTNVVLASDMNPYFDAETMIDAAEALKSAGAQFLRATGAATPSYAGALVAVTDGEDVHLDARDSLIASADFASDIDESELDALAADLRARVANAISKN